MTAQRDRLAAVLHDFNSFCPRSTYFTCDEVHGLDARDLLVRGVRVVDVDTLSRALLEAAVGGPGIRAEAEAIIAALDAAE